MCAPQLEPAAVIVAVEFDFTNYDVDPPSVTLVEPFTNRPYSFDELPTVLQPFASDTAVGPRYR
jgi:Predicted metal binding domain